MSDTIEPNPVADSGVHVFTSAAFNYIPKVRLLFRSLRRLHPEWHLHLALADAKRPAIDLTAEPFHDCTALADLDIPGWQGWAYCHTIVELATAIKPFMLARLLARPDCRKVLYIDPDIVAFSRLDDIIASLDEAAIVLTPHQLTPEQSLAAVIDNEICSLKHGVYNLGFLGVAATPTGKAFAQWWSERVFHFCRADIPNGLFTDQRWIDLVPAFFPGVAILRSPRHNVAPWNLTIRTVANDGNRYSVDGEPLGFYHFTGFDSGAHRLMAAKNAPGNAAVAALVDWYAGAIAGTADDPLSKLPWAYACHSDGSPISKLQRLVYRERLDLQRAFPNPFDATTYLQWWNTQAPREQPALFDPATQDAALARLQSSLTPGYRASSPAPPKSVAAQLAEIRANAGVLAIRAWDVLKTEGVSGLIEHISTRLADRS